MADFGNNSVKPLLDLRHILEITANTVAVIGLCLNISLLYLIFYKSSKLLADYKTILLQNCFIDIFFTIVNDITKVQTDYKDGSFFMIIVGTFSNLLFPNNYISITIWVFALLFCVTSIPVQFVYRYFLIVQEKKLKAFQYFFFLLISFFGAFSYASLAFYVFWPNPKILEAKLPLLKADPYFYKRIPEFFVADVNEWPLRILFCYASMLITVSYSITIITSIKFWKKLNVYGSKFSQQTKRIHKQMNKTIIFQAIIPFIFVMCPVGSVVIATFAHFNIPGLGVIVSIYWCWIPVANPLVSIFSIKCYRQTVFDIFQKLYKKIGKKCPKILKSNIYTINNGKNAVTPTPNNFVQIKCI